jgi:cation diffusion facilitator family transporter
MSSLPPSASQTPISPRISPGISPGISPDMSAAVSTAMSTRTVVVALAANIGVAIAKVIAAVVTASTAMTAEAAHACADVGNQLLLVVAQRRSVRPADRRHPLGYGREAYFWALLASVVMFVAGAIFSFREGIAELLHPVALESFTVVYVVLVVSILLDTTSLLQSVRQLRREAVVQDRDFLDQLMLTSDPTARAVFAEDAAAIAGDLVALIGIALHQRTGSSSPEGWAATIIGVILIGVGLQLARRNRDFLLGEQAPPAAQDRIRASIVAFPGIAGVEELLVTFIGPRQVWVLCRVGIDDELRGDQVESLVRELDRSLRTRSNYIQRVDIVPTGALIGLAPSVP